MFALIFALPIPTDFKLESDSVSFTQTPLGSRQLQRLCTAMHKFPRLASCPQSRRKPKKHAPNRASNRNPCRKGVRQRVACARNRASNRKPCTKSVRHRVASTNVRHRPATPHPRALRVKMQRPSTHQKRRALASLLSGIIKTIVQRCGRRVRCFEALSFR